MKQSKVVMMILVAVLFSSVLFSSVAFAKAYSQQPGEPPYGLKVQGAAAGTKLYGTISIEEFNFTDWTHFSSAKIVLRLATGNTIQIFYGEINQSMDQTRPDIIQDLINTQLGPQIALTFLGDSTRQVTLKNVSEFTSYDLGSNIADYHCFVMADVVLAVD